jgi:hypothetical protein
MPWAVVAEAAEVLAEAASVAVALVVEALAASAAEAAAEAVPAEDGDNVKRNKSIKMKVEE